MKYTLVFTLHNYVILCNIVTQRSVITCRDLVLSSKNALVTEDNNEYGTIRRYSCYKGHELISGSLERKCKENRDYDELPPTCTSWYRIDTAIIIVI